VISLTVPFLIGCSDKSMPLRVTMPPLPAKVMEPCALPSQLLDGQIPTVLTALQDAWQATSECEIRRAAAVEAYEAARAVNP
jgi:hypothetical protein